MPGIEISSFYNHIFSLSEGMLRLSTDNEKLIELIREVYNQTEKEASESISEEERKHMDCEAGCSTCCRVHVPVLRPESLIIIEFLKSTRSAEEIEQLKIDMKALCLEIGCLDELERIFANKKCIFLDKDGVCSIYPVRPLLCRSITSADVNACKESISMIAIDQAVNIPMNIRQKSLFDTAFKAVADAMQKHGFPAKSCEITGGVLKLF